MIFFLLVFFFKESLWKHIGKNEFCPHLYVCKSQDCEPESCSLYSSTHLLVLVSLSVCFHLLLG